MLLHALGARLFEEDARDLIELRLCDRIAFAGGAENVEVAHALRGEVPHGAAEDVLGEREVFTPRHAAGGEDAGAVAFGGVHLPESGRIGVGAGETETGFRGRRFHLSYERVRGDNNSPGVVTS